MREGLGNMSLLTILLITAASIFGAYEIVYGFWAYRKNGFWFYWAAGLLIGVPFLMVAAIVALSPVFRSAWLEGSVVVIWLAGEAWKVWMKRRAQKADPEKWAKWDAILNQK